MAFMIYASALVLFNDVAGREKADHFASGLFRQVSACEENPIVRTVSCE